MTLTMAAQPTPLQRDVDGTWRVGQTRVLLDLVIHAFNVGRTPEEIVQSYNTLRLEDVYAVIAYYLRNQVEVDAYLHHRKQETEVLWENIGSRPDYQAFRQRLLARSKQSPPYTP